MKKIEKIFLVAIAISMVVGAGVGIAIFSFAPPAEVKTLKAPSIGKGIMVMDDNGDLHPYYYIAKWNVYGKLPDDYESYAMSGPEVFYANDTNRIRVISAYLNYRWDNPKSNEIEDVPYTCISNVSSSLEEMAGTKYSNWSGTTDFGMNYTINTTINYVWELLSKEKQ